jgi:hypothetical protein
MSNRENRADESVSGEVAVGSGSPVPLAIRLVRELRGNICRCGAPKQPLRTFCGPCYRALPPEQQKAIHRRLWDGYEDAYAAAADFLDAQVRGPK